MTAPMWSLVVPAKPLSYAKSRLARYAGEHRADLAFAFAMDTVTAALRAVDAVVVVTDEPRLAAELDARGVVIVPDVPAAGLNAALEYGAGIARERFPGLGVAALSADLPALRAAELAAALAAARGRGRAFVADTQRVGTTLLAAEAGWELAPVFGGASREAHRRGGAWEIGAGGIETVRRDVDTPADLVVATRLGVGPWTREVLVRLDDMQATVRSFDPATRSGSVLLDDGTELAYDAAAFEAGGLRLLRLGQRVQLRTEPAEPRPRVTALTLSTFPFPDAPPAAVSKP